MQDFPNQHDAPVCSGSTVALPSYGAILRALEEASFLFNAENHFLGSNQVAEDFLKRVNLRPHALFGALTETQDGPRLNDRQNPVQRALIGETLTQCYHLFADRKTMPEHSEIQLILEIHAAPLWEAGWERPVGALLQVRIIGPSSYHAEETGTDLAATTAEVTTLATSEFKQGTQSAPKPHDSVMLAENGGDRQEFTSENFSDPSPFFSQNAVLDIHRMVSLLDSLPAIVFVVDVLGHFQFFNRPLFEITGYVRDDIQHMTLFDFFSHRARDELKSAMIEAIAIDGGFDLDLPLISRSGDQIPITLYGKVTHDAGSALLTGCGLDVSHVRETLRAAAISEERLSRSQAFANIGIWDWNLRTDEVYWSDRVTELMGALTSRNQFNFQEFLSAAHPLDRARLAASIENCVTGHDVLDEEFRIHRPDGSERWMLARANLIHDDQATPVRMLGVIQDITPLKHAEFIEKRAREQIQSIIDSLEARICVVDEQGEIISVNRSWQQNPYRQIERSKSLASGGNYLTFCDALAASGRGDMAHLAAAVRAVLQGSENSAETEIAVDQDGYQGIHLVRITPLRGSSQELPRVVINHLDVTKRREIEQDLRQAKEEAERASRAKSEFLSLMSHELRTPMNAVLGFAQLLEADDELNEDQQESVGEILKAGKHLLHLINEVLDLARIESGRVDIAPEPVALTDLVAECLPLVELSARQNQVQIRFGNLGGMAVVADRIRLKQVLINLLSNAVKYNNPGGEVRITARRDANARIRISVIDTGLGIASEDIAQLFSPFCRLDRDAHREGTGIGLAVCRRLVEAMGGVIDASSELGHGSCFWLELDAAEFDRDTGNMVESSDDEPLDGMELPESLTRILQIEDNAANLKLMDRLLARYPRLRNVNANSGRQGIELAIEERPDLILLDIHMPGMNGYQVLRELRADPRTAGIPVIAVTANATSDHARRGEEAGFDAYLTKPIDIRDLVRAIRRVILAQAA